MQEVLHLPASPDDRDEARVAHLANEPAKHPSWIVAINQPGPNHKRSGGPGKAFDLDFGSAVKRTAAGKRAEGRNEHHLPDSGDPGGSKELLRAAHIYRGDLLPAPGHEIISTVHQRLCAPEQVGINFLAETKSDRPRSWFRLPRPGGDAPACPFQVAFEPAAHKTVGTR